MKKLVVVLLFCFGGADGYGQEVTDSAKHLNNMATELMKSHNIDSLTKALQLLNQAIAVDINYYTAYNNKVNCFCMLGDKNAALKTLDTIFRFDRMTHVWLLLWGNILESQGKLVEALYCYDSASFIISRLVANFPDSLSLRLDHAFAMVFTQGEVAAQKEYDIISEQFPQSETVMLMKQVFAHFDRRKFISDVCRSVIEN